MPYDSNNRWVPALDSDPNWNKRWDYDEADLLESIQRGELAQFGIENEQGLIDLYDTEDWNQLSTNQKVDVLAEYSWFYDYQTEATHLNPNWGLDIERDSDYDYSEDFDAAVWFRKHIDWKGDESTIDYANYNDDELYQAARNSMLNDPDWEKYKSTWGDRSIHDPYDDVTQIRAANDIISTWSAQEAKDQIQWAKDNVQNYDDSEMLLKKYQPTKTFDPETNTTYYHHHERKDGAEPTGSKQWLPPKPAQDMRIIKGNAPIPQYDANGNRVVTEADITKLYQQYLGRVPQQSGIDYWMNTGDDLATIESNIKLTDEGKAADASGISRSNVFYNPQTYGTEADITAKLKDKPADIPVPNITINKVTPTKPTKAWMSHSNKVWTDPSVDTRPSKQGDS